MKKYFNALALCTFMSQSTYAMSSMHRGICLVAEEGLKFMAKRSISTGRITPGIKPAELPEFVFHKLNTTEKVKFLDSNHEFYIPLKKLDAPFPFDSHKPRITRENNHSIRIDLTEKKK